MRFRDFVSTAHTDPAFLDVPPRNVEKSATLSKERAVCMYASMPAAGPLEHGFRTNSMVVESVEISILSMLYIIGDYPINYTLYII